MLRKKTKYLSLLPAYCIILSGCLLLVLGGNHAVSVISTNGPVLNRKTVIVDAGHGGEDGGATSYTGMQESKINLEIAVKLNDLLHLLGIKTVLIRDGDYSVYTKGTSLSEKKISDLKERVRIVNNTENAILISIHQNYFSDSKYRGAQVFYANTDGSQELANELQKNLKLLDPTNNRQIKRAGPIYLLKNIHCPGILIECGFLSNIEEDILLQNNNYQNNLCSVIASVCSMYLY